MTREMATVAEHIACRWFDCVFAQVDQGSGAGARDKGEHHGTLIG
jgi:hypothetical protein